MICKMLTNQKFVLLSFYIEHDYLLLTAVSRVNHATLQTQDSTQLHSLPSVTLITQLDTILPLTEESCRSSSLAKVKR